MASKTQSESTSTRASKEIAWAKSEARRILVEDLDSGVLPMFAIDMGPMEAWTHVYSQCAEFQGMPYDKFRERLNRLRKAHRHQRSMADSDAKALKHDRKLFPKKTTNSCGEPVFYLSAARKLLAADIGNGLHRTLTIGQLHKKRREYHPYPRNIFKGRIYQEIRRQKFIAYLTSKRGKEESLGKSTQIAHDIDRAFERAALPVSNEERKQKISKYISEKKEAIKQNPAKAIKQAPAKRRKKK